MFRTLPICLTLPFLFQEFPETRTIANSRASASDSRPAAQAASAEHPEASVRPRVHAAPVNREITLDGVPNEDAWNVAETVTFASDYTGKNVDIQTRARFLWSNQGLFGLFELSKAGLNVDRSYSTAVERPGLYHEDCVELFIAPNAARRTHYYEIEIGPLGHWFDLEIDRASGLEKTDWSSHLLIGSQTNSKARTVSIEFKLAAPEIIAALRAGAELPLALFRMEGREFRHYLAWSPPRTPEPSFHVPEAFGTLVLD